MQPCILFVLLGGVTIVSSCRIPNTEQPQSLNVNQEQTNPPELSTMATEILEHKSQVNAEEDIFLMVAQSTIIPTVDTVSEGIVPLPTRSPTLRAASFQTPNGNIEAKKLPEVSTEYTKPEYKSAEEDIQLFQVAARDTTIPTAEKIVPLPTRSPTLRTMMITSTSVNTEAQRKSPNGEDQSTKSTAVGQENTTYPPTPAMDKHYSNVGNHSIECEPRPYSIGTRLSAQLLKILTRLG